MRYYAPDIVPRKEHTVSVSNNNTGDMDTVSMLCLDCPFKLSDLVLATESAETVELFRDIHDNRYDEWVRSVISAGEDSIYSITRRYTRCVDDKNDLLDKLLSSEKYADSLAEDRALLRSLLVTHLTPAQLEIMYTLEDNGMSSGKAATSAVLL